MSKAESQGMKNKEEANRRTPRSGKEPENTYSAKGLEGVWGWGKPIHKDEDREDWSGQYK